jgi:hypothetical protein
MAWTVESATVGHYFGVVAFHDGLAREHRLVCTWPKDATADEIADALERLAAEIRAAH